MTFLADLPNRLSSSAHATTTTMATLTPTAMLELPRPSAAKLSPSGIHYAQSTSTFDVRTRRTSKKIHVGQVPAPDDKSSSDPFILLSDVRFTEFVWADDNTLLFLRLSGGASAEVDPTLSDVQQRKAWASASNEDPVLEIWAKEIKSRKEYQVGSLPVDDAGDFKIHHVSPFGSILAFSSSVYGPDRSIYNSKKAAKKIDQENEGSVRIYIALLQEPVRLIVNTVFRMVRSLTNSSCDTGTRSSTPASSKFMSSN